MDLETVKKFVEKEGGAYESTVDSMARKFIERMVMQGMKIERGRIICSFTVPPGLLNTGNTLHGGYSGFCCYIDDGSTVEINVSYLDGATAGIESKALRVGKTLAVVSKTRQLVNLLLRTLPTKL